MGPRACTRMTIVVLVAAPALAACKGDREPSTAVGEATRTTSAALRASTKSDREFLAKEGEEGLFEVTLGSLAQRKSASAAVRAYGAQMISDHGAALDELRQLGNARGVILPTTLNAEHEKLTGELSKLGPASFDGRFVEKMVGEHEDEVARVEKASKEADDAEVRAWAAKRLPIIRDHLVRARALGPSS